MVSRCQEVNPSPIIAVTASMLVPVPSSLLCSSTPLWLFQPSICYTMLALTDFLLHHLNRLVSSHSYELLIIWSCVLYEGQIHPTERGQKAAAIK